MTHPAPDDAELPDSHTDNDDQSDHEAIWRWLDHLQRSDRSLYNQLAIEVWAIAQTMDAFIPGFWSRFMENRQLALQEFIADQRSQDMKFSNSPPPSTNPLSEPDGMMEGGNQEE